MNEFSNLNRPKHGEIWMCNLQNKNGSVQCGLRPVLIMSNNINNTHSTVINVIPISSKIKRPLPIHVVLHDYHKFGLTVKSVLLVEQITTIPIEALQYIMGVIADEDVFRRIGNAMAIQFPCLRVS